MMLPYAKEIAAAAAVGVMMFFVTPTVRLLRLTGVLFVLAVVSAIWKRVASLWFGGAAVLVVAGLIDALVLLWYRRVWFERRLPGRFALGVPQEVEVKLHNPNALSVQVEFFDGLPATVVSEQLPWLGKIPGRHFVAVAYLATSLERGQAAFTTSYLRTYSPLGLWYKRERVLAPAEIKTYPNYEPVVRYTLLAMSNRQSHMGIVTKNRVGQSREFHQLRDYQDGDVLAQIDWKATSRRRQIISREYREQRDQTLLFMLDCGRRMRAMDGPLPQFDHCLNATLLLSYIALRQGDQVGILSFGGTNRWLPPVKGQHSMTVLLNHLYDFQSTPEPSDFSEAAERILTRQRRRALVVLLTNLRTEDATQLLGPLRLLRRRHLVMVASLREQATVECGRNAPQSFDDALLQAAAAGYLAERAGFLSTLRDQGILTIDETPQALPAALANAYLDIKMRGTL